ncbi:hypothetical protein HPC49_47055 [Pyxidicoccus fallax]|uniref:Lipoprotein n=1 Tax=Pyxidicoccus fallax TaxID=394095 RepID=A0A848LH26_9BACT|nr:hypothetical protein [Pyxidicoccus fallax]NMO17173.1 hypothetical protein [Pyxidicoccus fallax]NPC85738.1 hypothetical protein [Pyxidicoccus fallax]
MRPRSQSPLRLLLKSTLAAALGVAVAHCSKSDPAPAPTPDAGTRTQVRCDGQFSDGTRISVASPTPLGDVPLPDQTFCDFHTFAWNQFLYLTQTVEDGNDPVLPTKPRFLSFSPWYNLLKKDGSNPPTAFPGGHTTLEVSMLDQKQAGAGQDALIDVAGQMVLYDIRFNQPMYDGVVDAGYYTQEKYDAFCNPPKDSPPFTDCQNPQQFWLPWGDGGTADLSLGSIEIKSAWRQFPANDCPSTVMYCAGTNLGLVGLHIAQKTPTHGEWVWASFEHVANTPDCAPGSSSPIADVSPLGTPWSFFNPQTAPPGVMTSKTCDVTADAGQCNLDPHVDGGTGFQQVNICRTDSLPTGGANDANCITVSATDAGPEANSGGNVACLNATLRPQLSGVWKNYQLIGTLWTKGTQPPDEDFWIDIFQQPKDGGTEKTAVGFPNLANTTMETYLQMGSTAYDPNGANLSNANKAGCFGCHNPVAQNTDTDLSHFPSKFDDLEKPRVRARK